MQAQKIEALVHPSLSVKLMRLLACYSSPTVFLRHSKSSYLNDLGRRMLPSSDLGFAFEPQPVASCVTPPGRLDDNSSPILSLSPAFLEEASHKQLDFGSGGVSFLHAHNNNKSLVFFCHLQNLKKNNS